VPDPSRQVTKTGDVVARATSTAARVREHVTLVDRMLVAARRSPAAAEMLPAPPEGGPTPSAVDRFVVEVLTALDVPPGSAGTRSRKSRATARLVALAVLDRRTRDLMEEAVAACREHGASWAEIGTALGISRQAAHERFGRRERP